MIHTAAFLVGLGFLLLTFASVLLAAAIVTRRRLPELSGVPRLLGYSTLATVGLLGVHLIPGALGILNRETVLLAALLALGLAALIPAAPHLREQRAEEASTAPSRETVFSRALAAAGILVFGAYAIANLKANGTLVPTDVDGLSFHVPDVARWIQTGTFWQKIDLVPLQAWGAYPNNGDVVLLAWVLPFRSDVLVRAAMLPYLALTAVAVWGCARELRAPRSYATLVAVALVAVPAAVSPSLVNVQTDAVMLATFATGLLFLLRHRRTGRHADLVLAGLALGVAFGTKWYGVSSVAAVIGIWAAAWLVAGRGFRRVLRETLTLSALVLAAGGFWLIRNLVETGDPLFPVKVAPFGVTLFDAPRNVLLELGGYKIADYIGSPHILGHYVAPALWQTLGLTGVVMGVVALAAGGVVASLRLRRRLEPGHGTLIVLAVGALVLAAVYVITPTTALGPLNQPVLVIANTRYLMPAVVPAAALTAWAAGRLGRWGQLLAVALLAGVLESVRRDFGLHVYRDVALAAALVALAIAFRKPLGRLLRQPLALVGAVVIFIGAALSQQHRYSDRPYRADAVLGWVLDHDPSGHRIGLAGLWSDTLPPVLPVFGPRFGNTVSYVGPVARHVLEQYADAGSFAAALTRGRYDLLVVGRGRTPPEPVREETWARLAGYREIVHSSRLTLFTAS